MYRDEGDYACGAERSRAVYVVYYSAGQGRDGDATNGNERATKYLAGKKKKREKRLQRLYLL